jgi:hypothetical protein
VAACARIGHNYCFQFENNHRGMAAKRKVQKINVLEACLCNFSTIFLAGFLLGFGMTVYEFMPHTAPGLLSKQALAQHSAAKCVKEIRNHRHRVFNTHSFFLSGFGALKIKFCVILSIGLQFGDRQNCITIIFAYFWL